MKKEVIISASAIIVLVILSVFNYKKNSGDFDTLSDAQAFANMFPEYPTIDNEDWWDPDFSSFYRKKDPTSLSKFLQKIGLKKNTWSIDSFNALLDDVASIREANGLFGRFIEKIKPAPDKKFVIWGNLQGAFHSFLRNLQELERLGVLSDDLHILDDTYYFVLTGNVIDRSPYSMEILTLVLQLLKKNPEKVFYLRGTHEDQEMWHNFGLKRELAIRVSGQEEDMGIPYGRKFRRFFNTLPLALYLIGDRDGSGVNVVRMTNDGSESHELDEKKYAGFLYGDHETVGSIARFKLSEEIPSDKKVRVRAIIKSNHTNQKYYRNDGLRLLLPEKEATTWAVLSAPTGSYRRLFGFFYDAFTVLTTADHFKDWTLTLYGQDVREMTGFEKRREVGLVSGVRVDRGDKEKNKSKEDGEAITIGSSMDLSRGLHRMSEQLREGLMMPLKEQNEKGGIKGRRITLVVKNDFYVPSIARENMEAFLKEDVSIIISPQGTANLQNYIDLVKEKQLLVLFPAGIPSETLDYLVRFGPSYKTEGRVLTNYAIERLGAKRLSFFYQNDKFGIDAMEGAKIALDRAKITAFNEIQYERNNLEFADQVEQVKKFDQDAILFFGIPTAVEEFIRQIGIESIAHDQLLGLSDLSTSGMRNFLEGKGLSMTISSIVPNPQVRSMPIIEQYQDAFDTIQLPYNATSLRGYICSSVLIEVLKEIPYPYDLDQIVGILENIKNYDLGGITLSFNPDTRELSESLWIYTMPGSEQRQWDRYDISTDRFVGV